jgi:hypothetical protein
MPQACGFSYWPNYSACNASRTALGFLAAIRSNALAGPSGCLLPCSQFCRVRTLTPIISAKSLCETLSFSRTVLISGGLISYTRLGALRPALISPASLILATSFSKWSFFTMKSSVKFWDWAPFILDCSGVNLNPLFQKSQADLKSF